MYESLKELSPWKSDQTCMGTKSHHCCVLSCYLVLFYKFMGQKSCTSIYKLGLMFVCLWVRSKEHLQPSFGRPLLLPAPRPPRGVAPRRRVTLRPRVPVSGRPEAWPAWQRLGPFCSMFSWKASEWNSFKTTFLSWPAFPTPHEKECLWAKTNLTPEDVDCMLREWDFFF